MWPLRRAGVISLFLDKFAEDPVILLHGACAVGAPSKSLYKGADGHADAHGRLRGWDVRTFPAEPAEGRTEVIPRDYYLRNQAMVDEMPDVVLAFFLSGERNKGTQMTHDLALDNGLYVVRING